MPVGFTVTYGGDSIIEFVDLPLARWHRDKAIELLDQSYEDLLEYSTALELREQKQEPVADGSGEKEPDNPTAYAWFHKAGQGKQPIIDDLGLGKMFYLFKTEDDSRRFMKEYSQQYNITDLSPYELVEVEITDVVDGEELEDEILTPEVLREIETGEDEETAVQEQADFENY